MKLKNKFILLCLSFTFAVLFFANKTLATGTIDIRVYGTEDYTKANEVLQIVNKERAAVGLNQLRMDTELQEAAMKRAAEIGLNFDHIRPNGTEWTTICPSKANGENIALGITSASQVMSEWMSSNKGHREAILYKSFNSIGVGCFKNGDVYYWVQIFSISNPTMEAIKTGTQTKTYFVSVLDENLELYAKKVTNPNSTSFMNIGNKGSYYYGIYNKATNQIYSVGVASDYTFTSSNSNVIKINSDGSFNAVGEGTATITISLKSNSAVKHTENITVKLLKPTKVTGLKAQNQKTTKFDITWNLQNETADKYEVYMYNSKKKDYQLLGSSYSNGGQVYGLISGTTYKLKIRAVRTVNGKTYYGPYSDVLKTSTATDKTKISKLKKAKKKITVNWKKISKATGYEIQVATDKKFTKNKKSVKISKNKTISTTIKKLKSKKKYYVRVRTYRKVSGKKIYSSWSSVKNVKTK